MLGWSGVGLVAGRASLSALAARLTALAGIFELYASLSALDRQTAASEEILGAAGTW